jgi:hypothetical protein
MADRAIRQMFLGALTALIMPIKSTLGGGKDGIPFKKMQGH